MGPLQVQLTPSSRTRPVFVITTIALALFGVTHAPAQAPSPDIHYVPTPSAVVDAMLALAAVTPRDVLYDLGSGDGRIVIAAARKYGARGVGIEIDPELVARATQRAVRDGVADKVSFRQADLFATDLSDATVVTLYLSPSINLRLQSKLQRELEPGARIVSHRFPIGTWAPAREVRVGGRSIFLWTIAGG